MKNLPISSEDQIHGRVEAMTVGEMKDMAGQVVAFEEATHHELVEVLTILRELQNQDIGISNKVLCAGMNMNHWNVIAYLHQKEWIEDTDKGNNILTEKGFREMNSAETAVEFHIDKDRLLMQNYNGALYWNKKHENFDKVMNEIKKGTKEGAYNGKLKEKMPPVSKQTKDLVKTMKHMTIYDDGKIVK